MARITLTAARVASLKPRAKRYDAADDVVTGLIVNVAPSGHKSFMLKTRYPGSTNPTRRTIGAVGTVSLEQARDTAREWKGWLAQGIDPAQRLAELRRQAKQEHAQTFAAVAELYIARQLRGHRWGDRSAREIRTELIPVWGERRISDIQRGDVIQLLDAVRDRGERTAAARGQKATGAYVRTVLDHVRSLFNFMVLRFDLTASPCDRLRPKDLVGPKRARERVLNDNELRALWRAADRAGYPYGPLFRLLALTGLRLNEAAGARWREFDFAAKIWTIPRERFKSDSEHVVPLPPDLLVLLDTLPRFKHGDHLFSTTFGSKPVNGFSKSKARLDRLMQQELDGEPAHWTIHDIRRTVRTRLSSLCPERVAEMVIGHAARGLLRIYDQHQYQDEVRAALTAWQTRLKSIVEPSPADNVVSLHKGA